MRLHKNKRGMTLIETLIAMSILALMSIGLMNMLTQCLRGWGNGTASQTANSYATIALQKLSFQVREGRSAAISSGRLVVTFPKVLTDPITGEKIYDAALNDPVTRSYYISEGNLVCQAGSTTSVLARGISASKSTFSAAAGYVDVVLVSDQQLGTKTQTQQATGHVALRNSQR